MTQKKDSLYKCTFKKDFFKELAFNAYDKTYTNYDEPKKVINNFLRHHNIVENSDEILIRQEEFDDIENSIYTILSKPVTIDFRLAMVHFLEMIVQYYRNKKDSLKIKNLKLIEIVFLHAVSVNFGIPGISNIYDADNNIKVYITLIRHYSIVICNSPPILHSFTELLDNPILMREIFNNLVYHTDKLLNTVRIKVDNRYRKDFNYVERCTLESNTLQLIFDCLDIYISKEKIFESIDKEKLMSTVGDIECRLGYIIHEMKQNKSLSSDIFTFSLKNCISSMLWLFHRITNVVSLPDDIKYVTNYFQVYVRMVFNLYIYEMTRKKTGECDDEPKDFKLTIVTLWNDIPKIEGKFEKHIIRVSRVKREEIMKYDDMLDHYDMEEALNAQQFENED
uniref:P7 n=1 Tax=Strongyloides papillosus TaxID=174720 RepID=A0A0N5C9Y3_STREA